MKNFFLVLLTIAAISYPSKKAVSQMTWNVALNTSGSGWASRLSTPSLALTGSFTLECWIHPSSPGVSPDIISKGSTALRRYAMNYSNNGRISIITNGGPRLYTKTTSVIPLNKWTHVSCSFNSTTDMFSIYLNGILDSSATVTSAEPLTSVTDSCLIGKRTSTSSVFNGLIDEVRIWNRSLSSSEISTRFRISLTSSSGVFSGLVSSQTFQDTRYSESLSLTDWTGNGNNFVNRGAAALFLGKRPSNTIYCHGSVLLDGANDYLAGEDNADVSPTNRLTLEAWIYDMGSTGNATIIHKGTPSLATTNYRLGIVSGKAFAVLNNSPLIIDTGIIKSSEWTHVAFTYEVITSEYSFYINGVLKTRGNISVTIPDGSDSLYIGGTLLGSDFKGHIDEVRISNYPKSQDQILNYMYRAIDNSNEPQNSSRNVVYNLDGSSYDNSDAGPLLHFRNNASYSNRTAPLNKFEPVFSEGFNMKNSSLGIAPHAEIVKDSITISQDTEISDLNFFIALEHTSTFGILIALQSPDGTEVRTYIGPILPSHPSEIITVFDDQADTAVTGNGLVTFSPSVKPYQNLNSAFAGKKSKGIWKLVIGILPDLTFGKIYSWGIQFNNQTHDPKSLNIGCLVQGFYNPATNTQIPDTMTVYLHDASLPGRITDTAMAVVSSSGVGSFSFDNTNLDFGVPHFIHLKHRNSLQTWSSGLINFNGFSNFSYDFRESNSSAYGNNLDQVDNSPIKYAVYSGDVNNDNAIDLADVILISNDAAIFATGYKVTDVTGNNLTDLTDLLTAYNNSVKFIVAEHP